MCFTIHLLEWSIVTDIADGWRKMQDLLLQHHILIAYSWGFINLFINLDFVTCIGT